MENETEEIVYDVITYTFKQEDKIPLGKGEYTDLEGLALKIDEQNLGDMIGAGETQEGLSVYVRNTLGLNDVISIFDTDSWVKKDLIGQYSQFKTLVIDKIQIDPVFYESTLKTKYKKKF